MAALAVWLRAIVGTLHVVLLVLLLQLSSSRSHACCWEFEISVRLVPAAVLVGRRGDSAPAGPGDLGT